MRSREGENRGDEKKRGARCKKEMTRIEGGEREREKKE